MQCEVTYQLARRVLKEEVKCKLVAMQSQHTTQCCTTTREIITTAQYSKHLIYLPERTSSTIVIRKTDSLTTGFAFDPIIVSQLHTCIIM